MWRATLSSSRSSVACVVFLTLASCCFDSTEAWVEDGVGRGTLHKKCTNAGYTFYYRDSSGLLQVLEYRDKEQELVAGACVFRYRHDSRRRMTEMRAFGRDARPTPTDAGWCVYRLEYASGADGNETIEHQYFAADENPCTIRAGYAVRQERFDGRGRLIELHFLAPNRGPASIRYASVENTSDVSLSYLKGAKGTAVQMAVIRDRTGRVLARKRISGRTRHVRQTHYQYYGYPYY